MANLNIRTPRFYPCLANHRMATGSPQNGNFDVMSGTDLIHTFTQGSEPELFGLRPMNQCSWDTSADTDGHVLVNMDTGGGFNVDFIAILNHNMHSADAKLKVDHAGNGDESDIQSANMGGTDIASVVDVVNGGGITGNVVTPTEDGSTIITFTANADRYWGIQFEGSSALANDATGKNWLHNLRRVL